jgi:hypothetical protein
VPYSEPTWLSKPFHTPYYNDTHRALQKAMREIVDKHIYPDAQACEDNGKPPSKEVIKVMADANIHAMVRRLASRFSRRTQVPKACAEAVPPSTIAIRSRQASRRPHAHGRYHHSGEVRLLSRAHPYPRDRPHRRSRIRRRSWWWSCHRVASR